MVRKISLIFLAICVLAGMIGLVACGSGDGETTTTTTAEVTTPEVGENEIVFTDDGIVPQELTISAGTTVTFINNDDRVNSRHWVKALDGSFDTRAIPKHARMQVTFDVPGVYEYQCLFHKDRENEKGVIIVE